ncbi:hypothetical protein EVAR_94752_1 [Eumeta japonica]|uniref:Uncharacterized protein n=1 Tax=Eumeta variegata TaxID=151549 RepID=A0A4C1UVQ6_EUMVA|nr:hypothetical protein EVAR_94752_1 [Eumeta japonica]
MLGPQSTSRTEPRRSASSGRGHGSLSPRVVSATAALPYQFRLQRENVSPSTARDNGRPMAAGARRASPRAMCSVTRNRMRPTTDFSRGLSLHGKRCACQPLSVRWCCEAVLMVVCDGLIQTELAINDPKFEKNVRHLLPTSK